MPCGSLVVLYIFRASPLTATWTTAHPPFCPCPGQKRSTSQHLAIGHLCVFVRLMREAVLTMDFPPRNLPDLPPVDLPQLGFPHTGHHHPLAQQAYGFYGVDGTFAPTLRAQLLGGHFATTQNHAPHPFSLSTALPSHGQHDVEFAGNDQSASAASAAPAGPASPMGPPARPRKRKAPTLRADDWEPYKDRILDLHVTQGLSLPKVRQIIEKEYGFKAVLRQYRTRISKWGNDKNVKPQEMGAIVRKRQRRKLVETNKGELIFTVRGNQVEPQKIERWMKRHGVAESFRYSPSPAASTPSTVEYRTVSERGSPAPISVHAPASLIFSPSNVQFAAQSPQMSSPALSVSSIVRLQGSIFAGQSPALLHRSLPNLHSNFIHTPNALENQEDDDARPRYRQDEEERLREQIFRAETSVRASLLESSGSSQTSNKLYDLSVVLIAQGRYKTAEEVIRRLVESHESLSGDGDVDVDTLKALDLLGKAERLYRRALQGYEKVLGVEHPHTLTSVSNLGSVLSRQGKYEEAEAMQRRALQGREKVLGVEHPGTLTSVSNLGSVLSRQGKYEEAEAMHRRALQGYEKVLGVEHPDTLTSVDNLGLVLSRQGKYEEAEAMHRRALAGSEKVLGVEHPDTLTSVDNLGSVLSRQGKYEEAEAMHRRALQGYEKVLGVEHPHTLTSVSHFGSVLSRQGKYEEAEAMHRRALQRREKVLGVEHPHTLTSVSNLGSMLSSQGKYEEAEAMHRPPRIC
ncbi:hypothetical protein GQ44DRAFT_710465 [Phaeosphaeriaceae sp. PMI808]|nr:hypothetical protein GQ44DRAFT_710465 [Phaeosphaeriaceae sp. PMI808]